MRGHRRSSGASWRPRHLLVWSLVWWCALGVASLHAEEEVFEGFTEPSHDVDVAAGEMGILNEVLVKEGDRVTRGQTLAKLDETVAAASAEIIRRELASRGKLQSAEAEWELQSDLVRKLEILLEKRQASPREIARAIAQEQILAGRLRSVREELAVKELELRRLESQLKQRTIVSPLDGLVTRVLKEPGEFVSPADPVAVKVVQLDPLLVVFSIPMSSTHHLQVGKRVRIHVNMSGTYPGIVEFVSPTADAQSGTTRVRVRLPNPKETIPAGIPCRLLLPTDQPLSNTVGKVSP